MHVHKKKKYIIYFYNSMTYEKHSRTVLFMKFISMKDTIKNSKITICYN